MRINKNIVRMISTLLVWIGAGAYLIFALGFSMEKKNQILCQSVEVKITDSIRHYFIERDDILSIISEKGEKIIGFPIYQINVDRLEQRIAKNPYIRSVQVYKTVEGCLMIEISLKNPIVRIFNRYDESVYLDEQGSVMPVSDKYSAHVLVVNGMIDEALAMRKTVSPATHTDGHQSELQQILTLARFISKDLFWNSMIEQIYINENKEIELIPRVGSFLILMGDIQDYPDKFGKLYQMYQKGLKAEGWNKYKIINLKYKDQIVCVKNN